MTALVACGNDSVSALKDGECPPAGEKLCDGDTASTQAQVDECNRERSGACGSQYQALLKCQGENHECKDDKTDVQKLLQSCGSQATAYGQCQQQQGGGGGGDDTGGGADDSDG